MLRQERNFEGSRLGWSLLLLAFLGSGCGERPEPPTLLHTEPASPSSNAQISVRGANVAMDATVRLYLDEGCTTPVVTGTGGELIHPGLMVTVPENTVTPLRADAVVDGEASDCSEPLRFTHDSLPPEPPELREVPGGSCHNSGCFRRFGGETEPQARVSFFENRDCAGEATMVVAGDDGSFSSSFFVPYGAPPRPAISVTVEDSAGNVSACSALAE